MGFLDLLVPRRTRVASARVMDAARGSVDSNVFASIERDIEITRIRERTAAAISVSRAIHRRATGGGYNRRAWDPAVSGELWGDFAGDSSSADETIRLRLKASRERSRRLARTNPYASRFFSLYLANVIGEEGLVLKPRVRKTDGSIDELATRRISEEWAAWGERGNCTVDGQLSWREVEDLLAVSWQRDGEALLRIVRGWRRNRWGIAVEPIEADRLDMDLCGFNGENEIRMGVELEKGTRRVVAYWILNQHPGEYSVAAAMASGTRRHTRVPADDIVHLFTRERIGQTRGVPRLEPGMARLHMLGGYEEAEVVAARAGSSKFAVLKTETGSEYEGDDVDGETGSGGNDAVAFSDFGQGTIEQLPRGWDLNLINPTHPTTQFGTAVKSFLRGIAAATPANYNSLANDLEGVNFSSLRHATLEERDQWRREQNHFASIVSQAVYEDWLTTSLATDALRPLSESGFNRYRAAKWGGKRWAWIDPLKEAQGNQASLPFYGKTVTEIASERGRTVRDIAAEIKEERAVFAEFGIEHPLDRAAAAAAGGAASSNPPPNSEGDE